MRAVGSCRRKASRVPIVYRRTRRRPPRSLRASSPHRLVSSPGIAPAPTSSCAASLASTSSPSNCVIRREHVYPDGTVVTEQATSRITYTQNWAAYNAAQCAEHDLFPSLLKSLCSTLSRPYAGKGRPRLPLSDIAFDCVSKIYSGLSARRFDGEVREAKERGLTDSDASFNTVLRHLRDPELTPQLQALVRLSATPLAAIETTFAPDATGFSTCHLRPLVRPQVGQGKEETRVREAARNDRCV